MNLLTIAAVVALLAVGTAYLLDAAGGSGDGKTRAPDTARVTRALAGRELTIPAKWLRYQDEPAEGLARQIELRLELPLGEHGSLAAIDVTLLPRSRVRPSAALLDGVYLHQFDSGQASGGPVGLVGKPLKPVDGYEGETVWYDALAADPFVAKCSKAVPMAEVGECLRTVYLSQGIAAVYAFPETILPQWRAFDAEMGRRLRGIGAL